MAKPANNSRAVLLPSPGADSLLKLEGLDMVVVRAVMKPPAVNAVLDSNQA